MIATISLGSCISVQGDLVSRLPCGDVVVRAGGQVYRGRRVDSRPVEPQASVREAEEERAH